METAALINDFKQQFDELVARYRQLKSENATLMAENAHLKQNIKDKDQEIIDNKKEYNTQQLANTFLAANGNSHQEAKNTINKIVREIDNCIALLNR